MNTPPLSREELQELLAHSAFIDFLNLTVLSADPEGFQVVMRAAMRPEFERGAGTGQWHGGPTSRFFSTYTDIVEHVWPPFSYIYMPISGFFYLAAWLPSSLREFCLAVLR
jgi:hypothetical protein